MSMQDGDVDALRSKVSIVSVVDCPPIEPRMVKVLIPNEAAEPLRTIRMQRPTYFEQICTVVVEGTSSPPTYRPPVIRSAKEVARHLYHCARGMKTKYGPPLRFVRPVFDTRVKSFFNVATTLVDIIPLCLHARRYAGADVSFVFDRFPPKWCRDLLSAFAIDPIITSKRISGPIVHIRGVRGLAAYDLSDTFDCQILSFLPETFREYEFRGTSQYDKIFLARRDQRALLNHAEVERLTTMHGYTTVYSEDYSVPDQMSIGANARHVVAIHGAAMAFLSLNRNIQSLIELFPPHFYHAYFPVALGARVQEYIQIIQEFDERIIHNGWSTISYFKNKPFQANLELLGRAIEEVEGCG